MHLNASTSNSTCENDTGVSIAFGAGGGFTAFQNFLRGNSGGSCGRPCTYSETDLDVISRFQSGRYEVFVQDTWRIQPTVTVDLGLRYAIYPPLTDDGDMLFTFSPDAYDPPRHRPSQTPMPTMLSRGAGIPSTGSVWLGRIRRTGVPSTGPTRNNLQPRFGAAWDPSGVGRTVVRAGYGMYFDQTQVEMFTENVQGRRGGSLPTHFARRHHRQRLTLKSREAAGLSVRRARRDTNVRTLVDTHTCRSTRQATRSWRLDGSTGTSGCSDASIPAA